MAFFPYSLIDQYLVPRTEAALGTALSSVGVNEMDTRISRLLFSLNEELVTKSIKNTAVSHDHAVTNWPDM